MQDHEQSISELEPSESRTLDTRWLGCLSFQDALALQKELVEKRGAGEIRDTALFLEHDAVYTIGRTRDRTSLKSAGALPHPVVETNRGGQATFHGPGQLVGYLILDLHAFGCDLHAYLRALEEGLIGYLEQVGIEAVRKDGLTGVWVEDRKIASIGVGVRRWITMHGFALNVGCDLSGFEAIVPCGIQDVEMTSMESETGLEFSLDEVAEELRPPLDRVLAKLAN